MHTHKVGNIIVENDVGDCQPDTVAVAVVAANFAIGGRRKGGSGSAKDEEGENVGVSQFHK